MRKSWTRVVTSRPRAESERAAAAYELLLARRPEAYADHAAAFFMGVGNRPQRALEPGHCQLENSQHTPLTQTFSSGAAQQRSRFYPVQENAA